MFCASEKTMLPEPLRYAIKTSRLRQYELAHLIHVHPGTLSAWLNGIYSVRLDDPRVVKLAQLLGVELPATSVADAAIQTTTEARA
jgi:hypothetical protein